MAYEVTAPLLMLVKNMVAVVAPAPGQADMLTPTRSPALTAGLVISTLADGAH